MKTLRLILGDQLNIKHNWFKKTDKTVVFCLFEMKQETNYVTHHIQKVIGIFAAMRQFSTDITNQGHCVEYLKITDSDNCQNLEQNLLMLIKKHKINQFEYLMPDEYRLDTLLREFCSKISFKTTALSTQHFYTERHDLKTFFNGKKQFLMETFYRNMRKKHNILMDGDLPEGGKWNYDQSNRNKWKGKHTIPPYKHLKNKVDDIINDVTTSDIKTIGKFTEHSFAYPINRKQALDQLAYFCKELLIHFGDYQDAMHTEQQNLFHSRLSFAMNIKLISPKDVITTVLNYYAQNKEEIDISQVEGFVRQIIGWREYMRGMYWALMPEYKLENKLNNNNSLASFFWTGKTKMNCLKHTINNSLDTGYAHHIQRLMVTGNYALLTQTNPKEVDEWYLGIYVDAIEWVQLPNTRGMSQFADGGKIATKPYVSSGSYINKMSNYCSSCYYDKNKKTTPKACPFNSLYWNFLDDKRSELGKNYRMRMMYNLLDKMSAQDIKDIKNKAKHIIENQDEY